MGKKKELAKLAKREAEIAAELERRAAEKARKKSKKKGKKAKAEKPSSEPKLSKKEREAIDAAKAARAAKKAKKGKSIEYGSEIPEGLKALVEDEHPLIAERSAAKSKKATGGKKSKRDEVIDEDGKTRPEVIAERKAEREKTADEIDAAIKARLDKKRAAAGESKAEKRAGIEAVADMVDRADPEAVRAYNAEAVKVGANLLSSDEEMERARSGKTAAPDLSKVEKKAAKKVAEAVEALGQAVEAVETEHGREFQVGESVNADPAEEFAKPSDATPFLESGRNGYKIIQLDKDGNPDPKVIRQYTRVTTYVGNIDDETTLKEWTLRMLAEGLTKNAEDFLPRVADITHRRDLAIAKAEKADRKGKLEIGELGRITTAANKEARTALNELVDEALELAGRHEKADAGTHLHDLAEIADNRGIDAVRAMHEEPEGAEHVVTGNDLASIEAYVDAMNRLGAENIISEAVIVNDAMKYAGRLDAIKFAKLPAIVDPKSDEVIRPADQRRRRYVFDVKSGNIEYAAGKISRQLAAYAHGDLYDLADGTRTPSGVARDLAIVVHLPLGTGECHVYAVDLKEGHRLLKLSESVRAGRSTGRKTIRHDIDLAAPAPVETEED